MATTDPITIRRQQIQLNAARKLYPIYVGPPDDDPKNIAEHCIDGDLPNFNWSGWAKHHPDATKKAQEAAKERFGDSYDTQLDQFPGTTPGQALLVEVKTKEITFLAWLGQ